MSEADAAFPMDALLREREWVRALARSLVRSEADADDLEQDAWVEALRRPPQDARSSRGWRRLCGTFPSRPPGATLGA